MAPVVTLPIVVQRGSYRLQLSNLKITDDELPQLLQRAQTELTNSYSQSQGKRATFRDVPLIEVTFNKNFITDKSSKTIVDFIALNPHVQSVELLGNGLTDASAPHIVSIITSLPIQRLKVGDNAFTSKGAELIGEALKKSHKGFLQLHIGGNPIGDEGVRLLCNACLTSKVEVIGLRDVAFGEAGWEALGTVAASATTGVHDFQLRGNSLSVACAEAFGKGIMTASLSHSSAFKLTVLSVGNCNIDGPSAAALFGALDRAHNLSQIDLSNNPFGDDGLVHLIKWLASGHRNHLQWLSLQKSAVTAEGIASMTRGNRCDTVLAALKFLDLSLNNLGEKGVTAVATIIHWGMVLERLNLRRCMLAGPRLSEICAAINHHPSLKEIDFASNFSGSENASHWADIVFGSTRLEHVVLTDNAFTAENTAEIVQSLVNSTGRSLSVLQLGGQSHVPPLGNVITPPTISKLNEALSRNRQQANDTLRRPTAPIQFDPTKLRQSLGYPAMPMPVPMAGRPHPDCLPFHPQLLPAYAAHRGGPSLHAATGNFACFAPFSSHQQHQQQPNYFMYTPLAGPAVYGSCHTSTFPTTAPLPFPSQHQPFINNINNTTAAYQQQHHHSQHNSPPTYHQRSAATVTKNVVGSNPPTKGVPYDHQRAMPQQKSSEESQIVSNQHNPSQSGSAPITHKATSQNGSFADSLNGSVSATSIPSNGSAASNDGYIGDAIGRNNNVNNARANPFSPSYQQLTATAFNLGYDYII